MNLDSKMVAMVCIAAAALYIFMEYWPTEQDEGISKWIPIGACAVAIYYVNDKLIDKSRVKERPPEPLGPQEPFVQNYPPHWDINPDGTPRAVTPPPVQQGGRRR